jgi:hypothetical protein
LAQKIEAPVLIHQGRRLVVQAACRNGVQAKFG